MSRVGPNEHRVLADLVRRRTGVVLGEEKAYLLESRLAHLVGDRGLTGYADLAARVAADPLGPLAEAVVETMVTTETSFFRDGAPFEALRTTLLPRTLAARGDGRTLRIWCAAVSTGQEAWSVAMLLADAFPAVWAGWDVRILATDVSGAAIRRAVSGVYSGLEVGRGLPPGYLSRYFSRVEAKDDEPAGWRVRDDLRARVTFLRTNLLEAWAIPPGQDLVLLRNVLIYFALEDRGVVLDHVRRVLRPGGHLLLGAAETPVHLGDWWVRVQVDRCSCYQLRETRPAGAPGGAR